MKKLTHEEYIKRVEQINNNIEVVESYINADTPILHKCKIDGYEWFSRPSSILSKKGCPKCAGNIKRTPKEYVDLVDNINSNIEVMGDYIANNIKILHRCKHCGYEWLITPNHILRGVGCPVCSIPHQAIGQPPEYKNSIWSSKYKTYFSQYLTEEQMKLNMPNSNKKINITCPDCERHKIITPNQMLRDGFNCVCKDGQSYPNKFIFSFLEQLKIDFLPEHTFKWSNKKRYDFYLPEFNCIIENHGEQHYKYTGFQRTTREENINDNEKQKMAIENGITHYVVLDCRKSNKEWIWASICNSELKNILKFNYSDIDLDACNKFATSNIVKTIAEYWKLNYGIKEISQLLKLNRNTVTKYLQIAADNKWCSYTKNDGCKRAVERRKKNNINCLPVYCLEQNKIYKSITEAANELKLCGTNISGCCMGNHHTIGGYHWYYVYDKVLKDGTKIFGAITRELISGNNIKNN